jgi:hypothetical protein
LIDNRSLVASSIRSEQLMPIRHWSGGKRDSLRKMAVPVLARGQLVEHSGPGVSLAFASHFDEDVGGGIAQARACVAGQFQALVVHGTARRDLTLRDGYPGSRCRVQGVAADLAQPVPFGFSKPGGVEGDPGDPVTDDGSKPRNGTSLDDGPGQTAVRLVVFSDDVACCNAVLRATVVEAVYVFVVC